eukprot:GEMP01090329.1.p1 GENE.GEMP01090329.1~~GEMP01090329.1.p1  ORF type:complete len:230 (+),score=43.03 GEMP01090329.1:35-724(+)
MAIGFQWLNKHGTPKGSQDAAVEEKRIELVDKESQTESCVIYAPLETRVIDPAGVDGAIEDFYQSLQKWVDREQLKLQAAEAENEQIHETMQLVMQKLRAYQDQYACNQPIPADAKLDTEALPMFLEGVLKDARNLDRIRLALAELMQNRFDEELAPVVNDGLATALEKNVAKIQKLDHRSPSRSERKDRGRRRRSRSRSRSGGRDRRHRGRSHSRRRRHKSRSHRRKH